MTCQTYAERQKLWRTGMPAFDRRFCGNEGFIRPVRKGQTTPRAPLDVPSEGVHYLVQDLSGDWVALISASPEDVFEEIIQNGGVPLWIH